MNECTKKQFIAGLLLVSCLISGWWLLITPAPDSRPLQRTAQADSLLQQTLADFNVSQQQVRTQRVRVDSSFTRTRHTISVPPGFSKTQFHAVLQQRFRSYGVELPARVVFPEQDMQIHLNFNNTVISTIRLATDEELQLQRSYASLIVAFEEEPSAELLQTLISFGEPIPAAVMVYEPYAVPGWWERINEQYEPVYLWPKTESGDNLLTGSGGPSTEPLLRGASKDLPSATLMSFASPAASYPAAYDDSEFRYINAHNALIFNEAMDRTEFSQAFRTFVEQARRGSTPLAIVMATEATLQWTREELSIFKKGGLDLTPPSYISH